MSSSRQNAVNSNIPQTQPYDNYQTNVISSNKWYSSVYNQFPSQPIFAVPLVFKVSPNGLSFSYPDVVKTQNTIFGSYNEDFIVGVGQPLGKPKITGLGDWDIKLQMQAQDNERMSFFMAHGVPYTIIHASTNNLHITFDQTPKIISQITTNTNNLIVSVKNHNYLFVVPQKMSFSINNNVLTLGNVSQLFVGILDDPSHVGLFLKQANNDLNSTNAVFSINNNVLTISYQFTTTNGPTLVALYPHQADSLNENEKIFGQYKSIRGPLNLIQANTFTTKVPLNTPPVGFSPLVKQHSDLTTQVNTDISSFMSVGPPASKDYGLATWFGEGASLLQLADVLHQEQSKTKLLKYMEPIFIQSMEYFSYQKSTDSFVAEYPEFGNEVNNDHHYHYGYFLRTGAILALYDPSIIPQIKGTLGQMADDIANTDKSSTKYPYLRNFDIYESHSWADGYGDFADGNDEESSPEAINAWYGVYLWGKVTSNSTLERTGLILYNMEIMGTKYYWFDIKNIYTLPYQHAIGSIIWGGKVDFATWFSALTNMKYGIQLLPFTPASGYLGTLPDFSKYVTDYASSGGDITASWGDLFVMWQSFYNPALSLSEKDEIGKHEQDVPESLYLYFIYHNSD